MLASLIVIGLAMHIAAQSESPQILQIFREALKSGSKDAYRRIEERTARLSAELGCPHPYLGIESLTGSKEVWWLNGYTSAAERKQVVDDYPRNTRLLAALKENSQRKAGKSRRDLRKLSSRLDRWRALDSRARSLPGDHGDEIQPADQRYCVRSNGRDAVRGNAGPDWQGS